MSCNSEDYFYAGNQPISHFEETLLAATIAGLDFKPLPPFGTDSKDVYCLAVNNCQPAEYATYEKVIKMIREKWEEKMLECGAPGYNRWWWRVECPIGKEKWFFTYKYEFPDDISSFLERLPDKIPINWVKIIEYANNFKKEYKEIHPNRKLIYDYAKHKYTTDYRDEDKDFAFLGKNKLEDCRSELDNETLCKSEIVTIADVCDGFDIDNL